MAVWRLGLAVPLVLLSCLPKSQLRPNLVLIVIDTARADRFSRCEDDRSVTPHFCEFAANAIRFERAYSTSTWTLPAHASLFTGLLPATHQATQESLYLPDVYETLGELLQQRGYDTAAFSNNPWVSEKTNLLQGFDHAELLWGIGRLSCVLAQCPSMGR